ncbi:MAG TPA: T9SS C-terminal target domain-containing protein [Bacteroidota bacterium]|nr:T9SS C-terminal target domain-containing protein [Bacteroidota bacterium]
MSLFTRFLALGTLAGALFVGGCSDDDDSTPITPTPTDSRAELAGNILGSRTLNADSVYVLKGFVLVQPGAVLTIPAGTRIEGDFATKGALITVRGTSTQASGKIIADGTASKPIIFTSSQAVGTRKRGDWGGIVLNGLAPTNWPGGTGVGEGNTGAYGGGKVDDNSGILRYVRIEYGGTKITPDNEINGLTLNGVGNATVIEHVQTHFIADDGFEWFGGTVNAKWLVSSGNDDDAFDMDYGFSGKLQFLLALQDPDLANRGLEMDNDASGSSNMTTVPTSGADMLSYDGTQTLTNPLIYNWTVIGTGKEKANDDNNDGLYIRRNSQARFANVLVTNFGNYSVVVDGSGSIGHFTGGVSYLKNSIFHGGKGGYAHRTSSGTALQTIPAEWSTREADPMLTNITFTTPDPRPKAGSPALSGAADPTADPMSKGFFSAAPYVGAFDGSNNWLSGWTNFAKN